MGNSSSVELNHENINTPVVKKQYLLPFFKHTSLPIFGLNLFVTISSPPLAILTYKGPFRFIDCVIKCFIS